MKYISIIFLILSLSSCSKTIDIKNKPIYFTQERIDLTKEYLLERYGLNQAEPTIVPKMIVLHWTQIPTLEQSFNAFNPVHLPNSRAGIKAASNLNVSAHFLIDQDGTIYRLMPEIFMARHVIGLNHCAIGIENVGGTTNTPLTQKQVVANIKLVKYLSKKFDIKHVIGHYEYTNFENDALWLEKDTSYRTVKTDPGIDFMQKVRSEIK